MTLLAAQDETAPVCGVVTIASLGRPYLTVVRSQLEKQLPAEMMTPTAVALEQLEAGQSVDVETLPAPVRPLFDPRVQGYLSDVAQHDPAALAAASDKPLLIIHAAEDGQVSVDDADALAAARPDATRVDIEGINHVLRKSLGTDPITMMASYGDEDAPTDPRVADAIAAFVLQPR